MPRITFPLDSTALGHELFECGDLIHPYILDASEIFCHIIGL